MNITRDVVVDLWPVYAAGEASADTRQLVEEFLAQDPAFAQMLKQPDPAALAPTAVPSLPPDREAQALNRTKRQLHGWDWSLVLMLGAINFTALAFGRIVSDTSWDVSPRNFIITAAMAGIAWLGYLLRLAWVRRQVYRRNQLKDV